MTDLGNELARIASALIRFRTTADRQDELQNAIHHVLDYFYLVGYEHYQILFNGVPSLVLHRTGCKNPVVALCAHIDVVEGKDEQFEPCVEGDKLFGRGAMDMKAGLAVFIKLMLEFEKTGHSVMLVVTGDEEVGGTNSIPYLLGSGFVPQVALLPDGGDQIHRIVSAEKGLIQATFRATGAAVHGSRVWKGVSAIDRLLAGIVSVGALVPALQDHPDDHWVPTFNVGTIKGGETWNVVADKAEAGTDFRFLPHQSSADWRSRISEVLPPGVDVRFSVKSEGFALDTENQFVRTYCKAVEAEGRTPEFVRTHGRSDASFFSGRGIPVIMGQPDGEGLHGPREWVSISAMEEYYRVVKRFLDVVAR